MEKANELRIGNLLDNGYIIVQVTSISLDIDDEYQPSIGICKYGEHRDEVIVNEAAFGIEIKPIPLTPEWLERLGYKKDSMDNKWYQSPSNLPPIYNWRRGDYGMDGLPLSVKSIQYLHQLQNLYFALTGEELTINHEHLQSTS